MLCGFGNSGTLSGLWCSTQDCPSGSCPGCLVIWGLVSPPPCNRHTAGLLKADAGSSLFPEKFTREERGERPQRAELTSENPEPDNLGSNPALPLPRVMWGELGQVTSCQRFCHLSYLGICLKGLHLCVHLHEKVHSGTICKSSKLETPQTPSIRTAAPTVIPSHGGWLDPVRMNE